jgi:hypothetical protein
MGSPPAKIIIDILREVEPKLYIEGFARDSVRKEVKIE